MWFSLDLGFHTKHWCIVYVCDCSISYSSLLDNNTTHPLPKFKEHLPRFLGNNNVTTNEHLVAFSNACHNIGDNDNDTCMCLFFNSLKRKAAADFFDLPPKILSTWKELVY
jgi:hypothetical protein